MKKLFFLAIALCVLASVNVEARNYTRYDLENHYTTTEVLQHLATRTTAPMYDSISGNLTLRDGIVVNLKATVPGGTKTILAALTDLGSGRLADMTAVGIDVAVLSQYICLEELDVPTATALCRASNNSVAAAAIANPTRIMGAMTLPTNNVDSALAEMNRCAAMWIAGTYENIFRYWHLQSNLGPDNAPLWDAKYDTLFARAAQLGIVVYIHPNTPTSTFLLDNGVSYAKLGLGEAQDISKTALRLNLKGLFDKYPTLRVVLGNYGGFLPFDVERSDHIIVNVEKTSPDPAHIKWQHNTQYYVRHRNILMSTSCNLDTLAYVCAKTVFDPTCMVFGSNYPFEDYADAVNSIECMSLPVQEKADIWQNTPETYVINGSDYRGDTIALPQPQMTLKTPTVTGYDFEHHSYIRPFLDTLNVRTTAPKFDWTTGDFYFHDSVILNNVSDFMLMMSDYGQSRLDALNNAGPNLVGVVSTSEGIADLPAEQAIPLARMTNDSIYAIGQRFPGRFRGEMCLPLQNVDSSLVEMRRCAKMGFRVWCIPSYGGTNEQNAYFIYEPRFEPLLAEAEKLGITIYCHPQISVDEDFQDIGYTICAAGLGFTLENMRTVTRLIMSGAFDRYPDLRIIVAHMGEYFPFVMSRMDDAFTPGNGDPFVQNQHPFSWYFNNRNILMSTSGLVSKAAFDMAKTVVGVDGILFSSDYPYENYKEMADFVRNMDLTQEELDQIWGGNAETYVYYDLPSSVEDVNEDQVDDSSLKIEKFFHEGHIYIRRGNEVYDMLGNRIK